jgi:hypothetical protein
MEDASTRYEHGSLAYEFAPAIVAIYGPKREAVPADIVRASARLILRGSQEETWFL